MNEISKVKLPGGNESDVYDIKDSTARESIEELYDLVYAAL